MKRLLAAYCCFLFLKSFAQAPQPVTEQSATGKKVLIKAIAVFVNAENNKKLPPKRIFITPAECPLHKNYQGLELSA